ncbi:MAG: hypothetical protein JXA77_06205 [Bacteroidales bacterium]|nr:hypothetical protein [Bacteroidales bacterium]MBN2819815.1 hypothetical protein [Bacteroidales bacterium]
MKLKFLNGIVIISILSITTVYSQKIDSIFFAAKAEILLKQYSMISNSVGKQKKEAELAFRDSLYKTLQLDDAFYYTFSEIKTIGRISSEDEKLVIYTWNIPQKGGFNNYYGIIQYQAKKNKEIQTYLLKEASEILTSNQQSYADISMWPGALYYKIVENKYKGQTYYTLLGFHFKDILSNMKLIDILAFNNENTPYFPQKHFRYAGKTLNRVVFEYNEKVQMTLDYNAGMEMIIFDHLSPSRPSQIDQFQFYGPDFSYDGLKFEDGIWMHESDISVTN